MAGRYLSFRHGCTKHVTPVISARVFQGERWLEDIAKCQRFPSSSCSPITYVFRRIRTSHFLAFSLHSSTISFFSAHVLLESTESNYNQLWCTSYEKVGVANWFMISSEVNILAFIKLVNFCFCYSEYGINWSGRILTVGRSRTGHRRKKNARLLLFGNLLEVLS